MKHPILTNNTPSELIVALLDERCELHNLATDGEPSLDLWLKFEGIYAYGHTPVDGNLLNRAPNVRVISNFGVGVDHIDLAAAAERGIPVGYTPDMLNGATADMTFALLLAAARNVIIGDRHARSSKFTHYDPSIMLGTEIHGATIGIVGMGKIGKEVARRARGFNMRILYHNRRRDEQAESQVGATYCSLETLLSESDFVALNCPLTPDTRHLIGADQLRLMKPTAILVNTARGGVIDHEALLSALREGEIALAAADVTEPEPLPRDHPLLQLDNFVVTPHLGSATHQTRDAMGRRSVENLLAGLEGRPLPTQVT
jgi:glyoxylate reductase